MRTIDVCYGGLVFFHRKLQKMLHLGYKARRVLNSLIFGYGLQKYAPNYLTFGSKMLKKPYKQLKKLKN